MHQPLSNRKSFFLGICWASRWLANCAVLCKRKDAKGRRGITTHWVKKQIWTLLNMSGPMWLLRPCGVVKDPVREEVTPLSLWGCIRERLQSHSQKQLTNSLPRVQLSKVVTFSCEEQGTFTQALLGQTTGDSGKVITSITILWWRCEHILKGNLGTYLKHLHLQYGLKHLNINSSQKPASHFKTQQFSLKKSFVMSEVLWVVWTVYHLWINSKNLWLFYWEGSAKTHIYIDICMRVSIKIPATTINDASSCSFPPGYPTSGWSNGEGFVARLLYGASWGPFPAQGPTNLRVWFVSCLQFDFKLFLKTAMKTWLQNLCFHFSLVELLQFLFYFMATILWEGQIYLQHG